MNPPRSIEALYRERIDRMTIAERVQRAAELFAWSRGFVARQVSGWSERYVAAQGTRLGREGRVRITHDGDTCWVGGSSVTCIRGDVEL